MDTSVPARTRILFLRQFGVMVAAGVNVLTALEVLAERQESRAFQRLLQEAAEQLEGGSSLSQVFARYPRAFPALMPVMLKVGEETGRLVYALDLLATWAERDERTMRRILAALIYPAFVTLTALVLLVAFLAFVVPGFGAILEDFHTPLPLNTRLVLGLAQLLHSPVLLLVGLILVGASLYSLYGMATAPGAWQQLFRAVCRLPVLGRLARCATMMRFCAAWSLLLKAGVDLRRALPLACQASGSPVLMADAELLVQHLVEGELISAYMREHPELYPALVSHMVAIGEQSAQLPALLTRMASLFDAEVDAGLETLAAVLEPLILVVVAIVTAAIIFSLLLPIYAAISRVGL